MSDLLKTQSEAAKYIAVTTRTIRNWKKRGWISLVPGRGYLKSELTEAKKQNKRMAMEQIRTIYENLDKLNKQEKLLAVKLAAVKEKMSYEITQLHILTTSHAKKL